MKAWLLDGIGQFDSMHLGDAPEPFAAAGEVVLRVRFAALNPADRYLAEGQYPAKPSFPHILGRDGIGEIVAVGDGVTDWHVGDAALLLRSDVGIGVNRAGMLAEQVALPADGLVKPPAGWTAEQAAGAPLVYLTAYQALLQWETPSPCPLPEGEGVKKWNVLVTGASGGVGVASIQLATALGHRVIGLSRGDCKCDALMKLGAAAVLDPTDTQWRKKCRDVLGGGRVDLAIDNIGGSLLSEVMDVLGENAKVACVGRLAGPVPQFNTASLFFRRIHMRGVFVGAYKPAEAKVAWAGVLELMNKSGARPVVDEVFAFDRVMNAFERLKQGPLGKVVIRVASA